jgi:hypothetical protein
MNRLLLPAAALALGAALSIGSPADAGGRKLLRFEAGTLQSVVSGTGVRKSTNYVLDYKVTNATDGAVRPRIRLEIRTDTGKTHGDAHDGPAAAAAAKALHLKTPPSSTAQLRAADVAAGATASGLACFGTVDPHARVLEVRVYGLNDRVYRDLQGRVWAENRVLVMTYDRPGDEFDRHLDSVRLRDVREIVDGEPIHLNPKS